MLPYTTELDKDQHHRYCNDLAGREAEANHNSDLQSNGEFDGKCGLKCHRPESHAYWKGYCLGLREHLLEEQGKLSSFKAQNFEL